MSLSTRERMACGAAALILALAGAAQAATPDVKANTLMLGEFGDGQTLWLVLDSVKKDTGPVRHGWSLINYATPQKDNGIEYLSDASKFYVNCETQGVILVNAIKYAGPMGGGQNVFQVNAEPTAEPDAKDYHPAHPGAADEAVVNAICKMRIR
jgi:hypothetical protein